MSAPPATRVFFDIAVDGAQPARVVFELFNHAAPKAVENFRALCTGEKGVSSISQQPLYYRDSIVHRVIPDFMVQGGDFTKRNGTGGESIYGGPFPDEDLSQALDQPGLLAMANKGPNTNGSQFFITLRDCEHLNGKHVVIGRVVRGFAVIESIADLETDDKDRPLTAVVIEKCGELELKAPPKRSPIEDGGSIGEAPSDNNRKRRKGEDKRSKRSKRIRPLSPSPTVANHPQETEEEYDARLEREENERLELERKKALERVLKQSQDVKEGSVRYKGRGRMKYVDPETRSSRS